LKNTAPVWDIRPIRGWQSLNVKELWNYRELLYFLAWRDIKVRYKQTAIGVAWSVLQPLALMLIFTIFFGRFAGISSEGIPYPLFALAGILPWQLFSRVLTESTNSLITEQGLITKVYFPRLLVPMAAGVAGLLDLLIGMSLLLVLMAFYRLTPGVEILLLPFFSALMLVAALGVSFWLSSLNVEYRDVAHAVPFLVQIWFFVTPVVYPSTIIPARWRFLQALNPMTSVVSGFRSSLLHTALIGESGLIASTCVAVSLLVSGVFWFRRCEASFVDAIGSGGH